MVRFIRLGKACKLITLCIPVKVSAVDDGSSHTYCMAVHILCCGMGNDIGTPLKRAAVDRCRKCIVNNQWNSVSVSRFCKLFKIKND